MLNAYCNTEKKQSVKVGDKIVGYLEGGKFIKQVVSSKHRLRLPPAWAIDAEAFEGEIKPNARGIVVIDRETGMEYHASVETFDKFKGELDRGFGRQYYLTLNHWHVEGDGHRQFGFWEGKNED